MADAPKHITPIAAFNATMTLPGSKSLTNRALLIAALAQGESLLHYVLRSDDTQVMIDALAQLGFVSTWLDHIPKTIVINGHAGCIPQKQAQLHLGNAGTAVRFLTAALCLGNDGSDYHIDGVERMRHRPIEQLVGPLNDIGGQITYKGQVGYPPLEIRACALQGGTLTLQPTVSSQFISALLMVGPYCQQGLTLQFDGPVTSEPYVAMTLNVMKHFGVCAKVEAGFKSITIEPGQYQGADYLIEPDASNASYFLAAAALVPGSRCTVQGLGRASLQGDVGFADVLHQMGAGLLFGRDFITIIAPTDHDGKPTPLQGIDIDLNCMPDVAQTLAVVALFAQGPTTIRNIGNLRVKETDRLAALENELTKLGAAVEILGDDLCITPPKDNKITSAVIDTYDDHRMAMSFALVGLVQSGVVINDPACVNKTYPDFFEDLEKLCDGDMASNI